LTGSIGADAVIEFREMRQIKVVEEFFIFPDDRQVTDLFVGQFDDMKMIKHNRRLGKMVKNGADVCRRHIHGDRFHSCPGTSEPLPEGIEGVASFAVANENHRPCVHVQNHRQITMPLTRRDFINSDPLDALQARPRKALGQIPLLDLFDRIPGDTQMSGHIQDSHMSRQLQSISFKGVAIGKPGIDKSELLLVDLPTTPTFKPLNFIIQKHPFRSDRNHPESPGKRAPEDNVPTPASRAPKLSAFALDREDDGAFLVTAVNIVTAYQPKTMVQKTRGHASSSVIGNL